MEFVNSISNHFTSPERKAKLKRLQEEKELRILYPKKLADTRWLSLGESLTRILEIWDSLTIYYKSICEIDLPKKNIKRKKKLKIQRRKKIIAIFTIS